MTFSPNPPFPRAYVFDLDGVLFRGDEVIPEAPPALARLRARAPAPFLFFLTNNSWQPRADYAAKLTRMGMPAREEEIVCLLYTSPSPRDS